MPNDPKKPTRRELQEFLPSFRLVKAFEQLFELVPGSITVGDFESGNALAGVNSAISGISEINRNLNPLVSSPVFVPSPTPNVDAINFDLNPIIFSQIGQLSYDSANDTLQLPHIGGVSELLGLVSYIRANNSTGSSLSKFKCVYTTGVTDPGYPNIALFQADGSDPVVSVLGLTAQSITNGNEGRVVSFGLLRGVDTSAFSIGDILYADPGSAGSLTTTKPTAPNIVVQIGLVLKSNSTDGWVFVNPIITSQKSYGAFLRTTDTSPAAINTAYPIQFGSTQISSGIAIGATTSRLVFDNPGLYEVTVNFQIWTNTTSLKNVWFWLRKNGSDVANSSLLTSIQTTSQYITVSQSHVVSIVASDYIEIVWASDSTDVTLDSVGSTAFSPASVACRVMINQITE